MPVINNINTDTDGVFKSETVTEERMHKLPVIDA